MNETTLEKLIRSEQGGLDTCLAELADARFIMKGAKKDVREAERNIDEHQRTLLKLTTLKNDEETVDADACCSFEQALTELKRGRRVTRNGWNQLFSDLRWVKVVDRPPDQDPGLTVFHRSDAMGNHEMWTPNAEDLVSEDWTVLPQAIAELLDDPEEWKLCVAGARFGFKKDGPPVVFLANKEGCNWWCSWEELCNDMSGSLPDGELGRLAGLWVKSSWVDGRGPAPGWETEASRPVKGAQGEEGEGSTYQGARG